jgi:hypothetical protein
LLERFPGRTLEELDAMNWARYLRAIEAQSIEALEQRRALQVAGIIPTLTAEEWERVKEHDQLAEGDNGIE